MMLKESLAYFASHQISVFCWPTLLDEATAADSLQYCKLFKLHVIRQVPTPIIRVLINVAWGGIVYDYII
jgi:hypothetical protein